MDRRDFLRGIMATGAALTIPSMPTQATASVADAHVRSEVINNRLSRPVLTICGGTSKKAVDANLFADVTSYREAGRKISVLADEILSRQLATLRERKDYRLWIPHLDAHDWRGHVDGEHDPVWSFFASLRWEPDVLVFQSLEDRLAWKGEDWLEKGWMTGHAVSVGVIAESREDLFRTVHVTQKDWWWKYAEMDDINASFNGKDVSGEFRRFISAANEALAA